MSTKLLGVIACHAVVLVLAGCGGERGADDTSSPIALAPLVTFEDADGSAVLWSYPVPSAKTRNGQYLISDEVSHGVIPVFDSTGRYLRSIGREGSGPGEYRRVSRILVLESDSILVLDDQLRRATILAPDLAYVRSFQFPAVPYDVVQIGERTLAVTSAIPLPDSSFQVINLEGGRVRAFASNASAGGPPLPHVLARADSGFWSAPVAGGAEITFWDSRGDRVGSVPIASDWMTPLRGGPITPDSPPVSQVRGLWAGQDGLLWILASVADPEWAEGLGESGIGEGGVTSFRITDRDAVFDSVIEALDSRTGEVVASHRFDEEFRLVPFPGVVSRLVESPDAGLRLELFKVSLAPPQE
ncbi:MAG: 6-bladed beta-propeller [Gemmatimonadetes bacterium]|nr:6-bladed beta-propeller [Gemmatimonadota bacterium]